MRKKSLLCADPIENKFIIFNPNSWNVDECVIIIYLFGFDGWMVHTSMRPRMRN
jgi:hypothetical protein